MSRFIEDGNAIDKSYIANMSSQWKRIHDGAGWRRKLDEFEAIAEVNVSTFIPGLNLIRLCGAYLRQAHGGRFLNVL